MKMPATEAQRLEARATEIVELAISGMIVHFGVSHAEAEKILLSRLAAKMKPAAIKAALKS
jgi:hypothetical protein